jgi:glucose-1-phosphate cytidylyltransferase
MKVVILCGGFGTRLSEETQVRPKPMVEIGNFPILWHIMKTYGHFDFNDFILALGYKGDFIKEYFINYHSRRSDVLVDLAAKEIEYNNSMTEKWTIQMVDTGSQSLTGGRLHRLEPILKNKGTFMLTYGDGVSNVDIKKLLEFHKKHRKLATVTTVRPPARFGTMSFEGDKVVSFLEKPQTGEGWINGGFFVFEPEIFKYLNGDQTILEKDPLEKIALDGQLMAFRHEGYWQPMDTLRDKNNLHEAWISGKAPWKVWED